METRLKKYFEFGFITIGGVLLGFIGGKSIFFVALLTALGELVASYIYSPEKSKEVSTKKNNIEKNKLIDLIIFIIALIAIYNFALFFNQADKFENITSLISNSKSWLAQDDISKPPPLISVNSIKIFLQIVFILVSLLILKIAFKRLINLIKN